MSISSAPRTSGSTIARPAPGAFFHAPHPRADALATRLEQGARDLAAFANDLTDEDWRTPIPGDGRKVGVIVHHVATMYPAEIELAEIVADGEPVTGVTWDDVHAMNAQHAIDFDAATKQEALELLWENSAAAAVAIRRMSAEQLDLCAPISLYGDAPLTTQFILEDHAVRHSYHHLARIRRALGR